MTKYPTPTGEGWYWAKLVHPSNMPAGEDWASVNWEIVEVVVNGGDEDGDNYLGVVIGGISSFQWIEDFIWGPRVIKPKELI